MLKDLNHQSLDSSIAKSHLQPPNITKNLSSKIIKTEFDSRQVRCPKFTTTPYRSGKHALCAAEKSRGQD